MTASQPDNEAIFHAARAIADPERRREYVRQACGGDETRIGLVEELLVAADAPDSLLDRPAGSNPAATIYSPPNEGIDTVIGPYKLLEPIGEGGFGVVYLAEQTQPVRRKVALKVLKPGMGTRQVVARFEAERQALALMDHPNIARVFDGGTSRSGRPFFAMELVKGVPITDFCDQNHLAPRQRLELFLSVCSAVQHAHQKGIIHRDLKPSNVLVSRHDSTPVVKVIDFGIAKALGQELTDKTLFTGVAQMVGTPLYMSPEQAGMSDLDVDARSDVYSLGVLLYELLTGSTPFTKERFTKAAYDEMRRIIREEEPPKPSTRLSKSKNELPSVAAQRQTEPAKLAKLVRGELDWIVMKALEKDRNRRYDTANGLAMDVQHYLADEPVLACPPSVGYRLRKFTRRNKGPVLAASLVLLALLVGLGGTTLGFLRADEQRQIAEANEQKAIAAAEAEKKAKEAAEANEQKAIAAAEAEKKAKQTAEAREAETNAVLAFFETRIIAAAPPEGQAGGLGWDVSLRKTLEAALPMLDWSFFGQPLVEARLRATLATSFGNLGEAKIAAAQAERARALFARHRGPDHPDTVRTTHNLANTYYALGRTADALKLREETLSLMKAKFGADHPDTLGAMNNLAVSFDTAGEHEKAHRLHQETLALKKAKLGPNARSTLGSMNNLAGSYRNLGRFPEALELGRETVALAKAKLGPGDRTTLECMDSLASIYHAAGQPGEAVKVYEEALPLMKAKLGPNHGITLGAMNGLSDSYHAVDRHADALKLREDTLALRKTKLGPDHPETLATMDSLARHLANWPEPKLRNASRALELAKELVASAPQMGHFWNTLGVAHYRNGDHKAAVAALKNSMERRQGGDSFDWFFLAMAHWQLRDKEQARKWYDQAVNAMDKNPWDRNRPQFDTLRSFRAEAEELMKKEPEIRGKRTD